MNNVNHPYSLSKLPHILARNAFSFDFLLEIVVDVGDIASLSLFSTSCYKKIKTTYFKNILKKGKPLYNKMKINLFCLGYTFMMIFKRI